MRTAREIVFFCRIVLRSGVVLLVLAMLAFLVWHEETVNREGAATFSAIDGVAASNASLRLWILMSSALISADLAATILDRDRLWQVFLDDTSPRRIGLLAMSCASILTTTSFLLLTTQAAIVAHAIGRPGPSLIPASGVLLDVQVMVLVIWLWALFGAAIGGILNNRALSLLSVVGFSLACLLIERIAVLFPAVAIVATLSPLGSSSVLVYGTFAPFFPQGRGSAIVALLALLLWAALLCMLFQRRYSSARSDIFLEAPVPLSQNRLPGRRA